MQKRARESREWARISEQVFIGVYSRHSQAGMPRVARQRILWLLPADEILDEIRELLRRKRRVQSEGHERNRLCC
jgi:hypothetical protein